MTVHTIAGVTGYKPHLVRNSMADVCEASFPGYYRVIANLPSNTVDAVLTVTGMLVYEDNQREIRATQVSDHEEVYKFAAMLNATAGRHPQPATPPTMSRQEALSALGQSIVRKPDQQTTIEKIKPDVMKAGSVPSGLRNEIEDLVKQILDRKISNVVRKVIDPLRLRIMTLSEENRALSEKIEQMEKNRTALVSRKMAQAVEEKIRDSQREPVERQWTDQGGLLTGLSPCDNPFSPRKRRP